jgi:beta-N-acetylhexosaminidase
VKKYLLLALIAGAAIFFARAVPLSNGAYFLAQMQFESAKSAFNRQDYYRAQRLPNFARENCPEAAGAWLLLGHCYYILGQDEAALFHFTRSLELDPAIGPLPPFLAQMRRSRPAPASWSLKDGENAELRRKIGQMIMVSVPGTRLSQQKKRMLNAGWVGGVILFNQNIVSKGQVALYVKELQANSPTPLFVAVDQEGGTVRRFREGHGFLPLPSLAAVGKTRNPDLAYRFGLVSGQQLRAVGANLNLAPVVDLDHGLKNSVISKYRRSLGHDPRLVSDMALQIVRGMHSKRVIATAKHFPTQSLTESNPHDTVAVSSVPLSRLQAEDLLPYRRLIENNLLDAVMLSHVIYRDIDPFYPASLSSEMIRRTLREKLGFKGLVISDDLQMSAIKSRFPLETSAVQAVNAGVDILLVTDNMEGRIMNALVRAVGTGRVSMKCIDEAYARIMGMKAKYGIVKAGKSGAKTTFTTKETKKNQIHRQNAKHFIRMKCRWPRKDIKG